MMNPNVNLSEQVLRQLFENGDAAFATAREARAAGQCVFCGNAVEEAELGGLDQAEYELTGCGPCCFPDDDPGPFEIEEEYYDDWELDYDPYEDRYDWQG